MKQTTEIGAPSGVAVDTVVSCPGARVAIAMLRHRMEDEAAMALSPDLNRADLARDRLDRLIDQFYS